MTIQSRAQRLYPGEFSHPVYKDGNIFDYMPIINEFGIAVVYLEETGYNGDTLVLLKKYDKYGLLNIGWGSCTGCDALQACESYKDVDKLIDKLEREIKWFYNLNSAKEYITSDDRKLSYYWNLEIWHEFVKKVEDFKEEYCRIDLDRIKRVCDVICEDDENEFIRSLYDILRVVISNNDNKITRLSNYLKEIKECIEKENFDPFILDKIEIIQSDIVDYNYTIDKNTHSRCSF